MQYRLPACLLYRLSDDFQSLPRRCRFYRAMRSDPDTVWKPMLLCLLPMRLWQPKISGYARKIPLLSILAG